MSRIPINIGNVANDGTGDSIRSAFNTVNENFTELYNAITGGGNISSTIPSLVVTADLHSTGNTQVTAETLSLVNSTLTKTAKFDVSGITANTTRTYTLPNGDTTLVGHNLPQTLTNKTLSGAPGQNYFTNIPLDTAVSGVLPLANGGTNGLLTLAYGGTGLAINAAPTNGQLLIGNGTGFSLGTITAGSGIAVTNLAGSIVIENTGGGGGGGGVTNAISDGSSSLLISNTSGTLTTTIRGTQITVANSEVTTNSTSVRLATGTSARPPILFPGGSLTTVPQSGAMEFDGSKFYITISGTRKQIATYDQVTAGTVTSFNTRSGTVTLTKTDVEDVLTTGANVIGNFRVTGSTTIIGNIYTTNSGGVQGEGVNIFTGNVNATGNVTATRDVSGATITASTGFVGTLNTNAQPNITSVGNLTTLVVTGNITVGTTAIGTNTVTTTNVSATNISGTLTTASQTNITALGTITTGTWNATTIATAKGGTGLTAFTSGGALYATSTSALTTGTLPVASGGTGTTTSTGTGSVVLNTNPSFTGTITAATISAATIGNVGAAHIGASVQAAAIGNTGATLTGTIQTAAQPNITSVGNLSVSGLSTNARIAPTSNLTVDLGTTTAWFNNVYGGTFIGVATTAKYADLAEKYTTDREYAVGTVMAIGGDAEARACMPGDRAFGVISEFPAYLMNSESSGQPVALKGRVPVFVTGPVTKGQRLVAGPDGTAVGTASHLDTFAIALESSDADGVNLVEAIIL